MWTLWPRECFAQYRTAPALPQPARVTAMAGEPARALVTDQITSSWGGGSTCFSFLRRSCFFFFFASALATRGPRDLTLTGRVSPFHLTLRKVGVKYECYLGTLVIHINLVSKCFWNVMRPLIEEFHCKQKDFGKPRLRPFFEGM